MAVTLRPGTAADAHAVGDIVYRAFREVSVKHNVRAHDFKSVEEGAS